MQLRQRIQDLIARTTHITHAAGEPPTRLERALRYMYDLGRLGLRNLQQDRAPQMAAALSFRSFFALIPVLVVATVLIKALKGDGMFQSIVDWVIQSVGIRAIAVGEGESAKSLDTVVQDLLKAADSVNLQVLGWIGMMLTIYAAIALMVTIENAFNQILRAPTGRSWARRVPLYFFVLVNGPLAIALTQFVDARVNDWIRSVPAWDVLLSAVGMAWNFVFLWLFMFAVYRLVPNIAVRMSATFAGSCVAALLLLVGKTTLAAYFANAFSLSVLYSSLGLIPILMFWVYLMWLVVLFGLEVTATVHMLHGRTPEDLEPRRASPGLVDPAGIVYLMQHVAACFAQGKPVTASEASGAVGLPGTAVSTMLERLASEGLLHRVETGEGGYVLARPPEQISADRLLAIGFALVDEGETGATGAIVLQMREAQLRVAAGITLAPPTTV